MNLFELMLIALFMGVSILAFHRFVPRCPECGGLWVTNLRGLPFLVCERCKAVWRVD